MDAVRRIASWMPVPDDMLDTTPATPAQVAAMDAEHRRPQAGMAKRREDIAMLTSVELAAVRALLHDDYIEVGNEAGRFYEGQAEGVIVALRDAGFVITHPNA